MINWLSSINRVMAILAGVVIVIIACLTVVNILLRFFTGQAIVGVEEIIQVAMVPVIFLSISFCGQLGGHIQVDLLGSLLPRWFWRIVDPVIRIMGATAFSAMAYQAMLSGMMAGEFNELTNIRKIPHQPIWCLLALGAAFAGLIELSKFWLSSENLSEAEGTDDH